MTWTWRYQSRPFFSLFFFLLSAKRVPRQSLAGLAHELGLLYAQGGFIIHIILMDMEFENIKNGMELVDVNITAAREQVADKRKDQMCSKEPPVLVPT